MKNKYNDNQDGTFTLEITKRNGNKFKCLLDELDVPKVKHYSWRVSSWGYVQAHCDGTTILMHRYLMKAKGRAQQIDHKSGDKLDNRQSNLRFCTPQQNQHNRIVLANNSIGVANVGFHFNNGTDYMRAGVKNQEGKAMYKMFSIKKLGIIEATKQAAIAASSMRSKFHGEFARAG